jgi:hypothetical protein
MTDTRTKFIGVRLGDDEFAQVELAARARHLKSSTYARVAAVAAAEGIPFLTNAEIEAVWSAHEQLRRAGNNLNTLLLHVHVVRQCQQPAAPVTEERIRAVVDALRDRVTDLEQAFEPLRRAGLKIAASTRRQS